MKLVWLLIILSLSCSANEPDKGDSGHGGVLLFKSGFENGVTISSDMNYIHGADEHYKWEATPSWIRASNFVYLVNDTEHLRDFMESAIISAPGPNGKKTNVLCMANKADDPMHQATSRNEYSFFCKSPPDDYKEGYVRYWMKLPDDLDKRIPFEKESSWYVIMEWKEPNSGNRLSKEECRDCCNASQGGTNNYRININLRKDKNSDKLHWDIRAEHPQPCRVEEWTYASKNVKVSLGEWFLVEAYMKKDVIDGRLYFAVDGEVVLDTDIVRPVGFEGRTVHPDNPLPLHFWSPLKNYHNMEWNAKGEIIHLYDDFEMWSSFPPGHPALLTKKQE
ncbi:hypothetical protein [Mariniphaga anaerophila]|uniref:hypothetical protein n=1 Tax=Mariniphaga anaerophila TaxID=1484053 RepID=UPI001114E852|nr:hypothetical protein [Mariniphaga anaerophila]